MKKKSPAASPAASGISLPEHTPFVIAGPGCCIEGCTKSFARRTLTGDGYCQTHWLQQFELDEPQRYPKSIRRSLVDDEEVQETYHRLCTQHAMPSKLGAGLHIAQLTK